ncbi:MAG: hypothetical protein ACRCTU_11565, partial [Zoogloea sp.]|uniref:hypothetical protein n=1 Tax=Zoogloea sp. TaxID=49181 RepID=UPI003F406DBF
GMPMPEVPDIPGGPAKPPSQAEWRYLRALEQWQFCAHFSRSALGKKNGRQHTPDMAKLWSHAENLHQNMQRTGDWNRPEFLGGRLNPHFQFEPFRWLRGLDVAGNENDLPIEWFAPMLRWLRQPIPNPCTLHQPRSGFHFSIHAGEDYAHPLSGLRHVDETVRFCQMRDGDRLGHALALGIKPKRWIAQHGDVLLPVDEHLDNLVWAWHHATLLSRRLPLAMQVLPALERRIQRMLPYGAWLHTRPFDAYTSRPTPQECICRPHERLTPELLHEAWQLRRNCRYTFTRLGKTPALSAKEQIAVPDLQRLQSSLRSEDEWSAEAQYLRRQQGLALGHASPYLVLVRAQHADDCHPELDHLPEDTQETVIHDSDSPEELRFMHALQDYLLHEYDRKGLIIETNPTSNVYIGRIGKHKNHPIFRWNPPDESLLAPGAKYNRYGLRRGPIRVLVNTDDPGIMPTTLRTEFALLREAAIERGIARTVAEDWLERLRRYGVEQFHRNHLPVFTPTHAPE